MDCNPINNPPLILVVADHHNDIQIIEWALENYKYRIMAAHQAADAYHLLESERPDLLILDLVLPEQDGLKYLFDLTSNFPCVPIIIQSAYAAPQIAIEALRNGAYDFWQKPLRNEAIKVGVLRAINHRRHLVERSSHIQLLKTQAARLKRSRSTSMALERMALLGHLTQGLMHEISHSNGLC